MVNYLSKLVHKKNFLITGNLDVVHKKKYYPAVCGHACYWR